MFCIRLFIDASQFANALNKLEMQLGIAGKHLSVLVPDDLGTVECI
jgi:hypothetical protein